MIEQVNNFPHPFPLPADSTGTGLPEGWRNQPIDDQIKGLKNNRMFASPHAFAAASLELAARRMDCRDGALGRSALHLETLTEQWHGQGTVQAYEAGKTEYRGAILKGKGPGGFMGARISKVFGLEVINPRMWSDILGYNRMKGGFSRGKTVLLGEGTFNAMKSEGWPDNLVALAGLQYLRQSASGAVKNISSLMLCPEDELPRTKDESEAISRFWAAKMAGSQNSLGIAYFLGYRDKLAPILRGEMRKLWGDQYSSYRQAFTTALNINSAGLGDRIQRYAHNKVRRPAYALIQQGHFNAARDLMAEEAATEDGKRIFSPISLQYLLGNNYRKEVVLTDAAPF
ncbi:MAG TPA: hypothetical protein VF733_05455 [Candidatus Saccharimonadales bacterium]